MIRGRNKIREFIPKNEPSQVRILPTHSYYNYYAHWIPFNENLGRYIYHPKDVACGLCEYTSECLKKIYEKIPYKKGETEERIREEIRIYQGRQKFDFNIIVRPSKVGAKQNNVAIRWTTTRPIWQQILNIGHELDPSDPQLGYDFILTPVPNDYINVSRTETIPLTAEEIAVVPYNLFKLRPVTSLPEIVKFLKKSLYANSILEHLQLKLGD